MDRNEDTGRFVKGKSGNPNGRPLKLETVLKKHFLGDYGIKMSNSQISELIGSVLPLSISEIKKMSKDDELPFFIAIIAKKAIADYEKGNMELVNMLLDRVYGRPKQQNEINLDSSNSQKLEIDFKNVTVDELTKLIESSIEDKGSSEDTES